MTSQSSPGLRLLHKTLLVCSPFGLVHSQTQQTPRLLNPASPITPIGWGSWKQPILNDEQRFEIYRTTLGLSNDPTQLLKDQSEGSLCHHDQAAI